MSMLDSFFSKGFKAAKCKTLLKLTIPRIKLLRNRREIQIKHMRRDIAKLLETGQEATARIRVEHIIREEKMMAAQEIIELFCELITVRLPIIEVQRECPLDLKEAISSVCFAAPRCADLPELLQVQISFAAKYGKEFISAATELMPECGVNRQLVELLSVRAPDPDVKLKLLKEIAEEHELDWDPAASETELLKPHEDLLNGPTQFVSASKLPLPKEKHDESLHSASEQEPNEQSDSDTAFDTLDFPEVPKVSVRPSIGTVSAPEMLPFPEVDIESAKTFDANESSSHEPHFKPDDEVFLEKSVANSTELPKIPVGSMEDKQYVPFISAPSLSSATFSVRQSEPPPPLSRTKSEANVDLQDVLAAAQAAAETAERAAAAARSAASLAQIRISELVKKRSDEISDGSSVKNPFYADTYESTAVDKPHLSHQNSSSDSSGISNPPTPHQEVSGLPSYDDPKMEYDSPLSNSHIPGLDTAHHQPQSEQQVSSLPSYDDPKVEFDSPLSKSDIPGHDTALHPPQRSTSMDDESYSSYPGLFTRQDSDVHSLSDNYRSTSEQQVSSLPSYDNAKVEFDSSLSKSDIPGHDTAHHQPQRSTSMDDESYVSYPNLFTRQDSNVGSGVHSSADNFRSTHEL
ncbi:hypothetical protein HYC85_020145 [Camellia sinensis]|uniref:IST1-like protein n=1 Tax=Camellia sinensis TaxID=4442 RepID=A0A7J7GNY4_CAMSI|nr:hypothetical protein HYC85_020145 [Camellia sinensis]